VAHNLGQVGSQLFVSVVSDSNGLLMANTLLVSAPGGDPNCPVGVPGGIAMVSVGGNISSDNSLCNLMPTQLGDQIGVANTGLAATLADNGGDTRTLSIPQNSPATGSGLVIHCPDTDQRGVVRPAACAVGAFEPGEVTNLTCGEASEVGGNLSVGVPGSRVITASDALIALRAAVDTAQCPLCACDVNDSGAVTASDALLVLAVLRIARVSRGNKRPKSYLYSPTDSRRRCSLRPTGERCCRS
jgi:hypothetical protein